MSSNIPKYPRRMMVYIDCMMFLRACFRVWLKAPRLIPAFFKRNKAFSWFVSDFPETFGARKSIRSVSSCVLVRLLFLESILMIGSLVEPESHFCTSSLDANESITCRQLWDTVLYTMYGKDLWSFLSNVKVSHGKLEEATKLFTGQRVV